MPGVAVNEAFKYTEKYFANRIPQKAEFDHYVRVDVLDVVNVGDTFNAADYVCRETDG